MAKHRYAELFQGVESLDKVYIDRRYRVCRYLGVLEGYICLGVGRVPTVNGRHFK